MMLVPEYCGASLSGGAPVSLFLSFSSFPFAGDLVQSVPITTASALLGLLYDLSICAYPASSFCSNPAPKAEYATSATASGSQYFPEYIAQMSFRGFITPPNFVSPMVFKKTSTIFLPAFAIDSPTAFVKGSKEITHPNDRRV